MSVRGTITMKRLFSLALLLVLVSPAVSAQAAPRHRKMVWAHYVGWSFPLVEHFDEAMTTPGGMLHPYPERTLLGKNIQERAGIWAGARKQIECARHYGVDGFCVNVMKARDHVATLQRFLRAAEHLPFKIALSINDTQYTDEFCDETIKCIERFQGHPNACLIDGKMVFFVYLIGRMDGWKRFRMKLRARGLDGYFIGQAMQENTMWDDPVRLARVLEEFEGFYDFGCNGLLPEQMKMRLLNARAALDKHRPGGLLVGGVAPGYIGGQSGFYRPFLNSGSFRGNWEACLACDADWVCLTTWNDYNENTQFEPTTSCRDNLLLMNAEYADIWRKKEPCTRPPRVVYSYHEEMIRGDDLTIDVTGFRFTTPVGTTAQVRLLGLDGQVVHAFAPIELNRARCETTVLRLNHEALKDWKYLRVQAAVTPKDTKPVFRELYPIVRRLGRVENKRVVRIRQDDLMSHTIVARVEGDALKVAVKGWVFAGSIEVLKNGYPIATREHAHLGPEWNVTIPLPRVMRSPEDVFVVRATDSADRVGYSNPAIQRRIGYDSESLQPVVVTGSDYDEGWSLWPKRLSRLAEPRVEMVRVRESDIFALAYTFDRPAEKILVSDGPWAIPARVGTTPYWWITKPNGKPRWVTATGPAGAARTVVSFDGTNNIIGLAIQSVPCSTFTVEAQIRPEPKSGEMVIWTDSAVNTLKIDKDFRLVVQSHDDVATSPCPLVPGKWAHVAAVYDARSLKLYMDGKCVATQPARAQTDVINKTGAIGNNLNRTAGFKGQMAAIRIDGAVRTPAEFSLQVKP